MNGAMLADYRNLRCNGSPSRLNQKIVYARRFPAPEIDPLWCICDELWLQATWACIHEF